MNTASGPRYFNQVIDHVLHGRRKATKYVSPSLVIKATARHKPRRGVRTVEVLVTVGKPNYSERLFVKQATKAREPFPIKRIQFKEWK